MNIPKKINIMGNDYKVKIVSDNEFRKASCDPDLQFLTNGQVGMCVYPTREIYLADSQKGKMLYMTFIHEIRHGMQLELGYPQIMHSQMLEVDAESFVSFIDSMKRQKIL